MRVAFGRQCGNVDIRQIRLHCTVQGCGADVGAYIAGGGGDQVPLLALTVGQQAQVLEAGIFVALVLKFVDGNGDQQTVIGLAAVFAELCRQLSGKCGDCLRGVLCTVACLYGIFIPQKNFQKALCPYPCNGLDGSDVVKRSRIL